MKFVFILLSCLLECYVFKLFLDEYYYQKEIYHKTGILCMVIIKALVMTYTSYMMITMISELLLIYGLTLYYEFYRKERYQAILILFVLYEVIDIIALLSVSHFFFRTFEELRNGFSIFSLIYMFLPKYIGYALVKIVMIEHDFSFSKEKIQSHLLLVAPLLLFVMVYILSTFGFIFTPDHGFSDNVVMLLLILGSLHLIVFTHYFNQRNRLLKDKVLPKYEQEDYTQSIMQKIEENLNKIKHIRHDLNHQFYILQEMLDSEQYDEAKAYLASMTQTTQDIGKYVETPYPYINRAINTKIEKMKSIQADVQLMIGDVHLGNLDEKALSNVLVNALENAYEALLEAKMKVFKLMMYQDNDILHIQIENSVKDDYIYYDGQTSKTDVENHGFGLKTIRHYVHHQHGTMSIRVEHRFILTIDLPTKR